MYFKYDIQGSSGKLLTEAEMAANIFIEGLNKENVLGISIIGALARGYFDKYSDIDIIVYYDDEYSGNQGNDYFEINGFNIECTRKKYSEDLEQQWDFARRQAYTSVKIEYDPQGKIAELYKEKLSIDPEEFRKKMIFEIVLAEWDARHQADAWMDRGDIFSAQKLLDSSIKHLVNSLYLLDRKFIPDEKWYYHFVDQLQCVDNGLIEEIKSLWVIKSIDKESTLERQAKLLPIIDKVKSNLEESLGMNFSEMKEDFQI